MVRGVYKCAMTNVAIKIEPQVRLLDIENNTRHKVCSIYKIILFDHQRRKKGVGGGV